MKIQFFVQSWRIRAMKARRVARAVEVHERVAARHCQMTERPDRDVAADILRCEVESFADPIAGIRSEAVKRDTARGEPLRSGVDLYQPPPQLRRDEIPSQRHRVVQRHARLQVE